MRDAAQVGMEQVIATLQLFWDKDVKKVSAGALGMVMGGPMEESVAQLIAERLPFARWDKGWIILETEPKGGK